MHVHPEWTRGKLTGGPTVKMNNHSHSHVHVSSPAPPPYACFWTVGGKPERTHTDTGRASKLCTGRPTAPLGDPNQGSFHCEAEELSSLTTRLCFNIYFTKCFYQKSKPREYVSSARSNKAEQLVYLGQLTAQGLPSKLLSNV